MCIIGIMGCVFITIIISLLMSGCAPIVPPPEYSPEITVFIGPVMVEKDGIVFFAVEDKKQFTASLHSSVSELSWSEAGEAGIVHFSSTNGYSTLITAMNGIMPH